MTATAQIQALDDAITSLEQVADDLTVDEADAIYARRDRVEAIARTRISALAASPGAIAAAKDNRPWREGVR